MRSCRRRIRERWWGVRERTRSERPIADPELPVPLSGSALTTIVDCPLRWFLTRRAGGETPSTSAIGFGMVLHTLADAVATGTLPPSIDELNGWLDKVWTQLEFESAWISDRERVEAEQALRRFVAWHQGRPDRTLVGTEVDFDVLLPDTDKPAVRVKGRMDRVEQDAEGTIRVVDLKTGRTLPTKPAVARHVQLAIYQRAIASRQMKNARRGPGRRRRRARPAPPRRQGRLPQGPAPGAARDRRRRQDLAGRGGRRRRVHGPLRRIHRPTQRRLHPLRSPRPVPHPTRRPGNRLMRAPTAAHPSRPRLTTSYRPPSASTHHTVGDLK